MTIPVCRTVFYRFLLLLLLPAVFHMHVIAQKQKIWADADTGNETDDVYAIARFLADTTTQVIGLSAAQFNNANSASAKTALGRNQSAE